MPKTAVLRKTQSPSATSIPDRLVPKGAAPVPRLIGGVRSIYAATIVLSAFLLFLVQPVLAKVILPWFGGGASVWTVAILFFQGMLLLGYTYAYLSTRYLPPWAQSALHVTMLAGSLLFLPMSPWRVWQPGAAGDPAIQILKVLLLSAGLPYFLLSTTGPLVQAWFAQSQRVAFPYRLFALSNVGSLAALLTYPVLVEPYSTTRQQLGVWSVAYGAFVLLCSVSAVHFWRRHGDAPSSFAGTVFQPVHAPRRLDYVTWMLLAACGSALLLTVTNHISQNMVPMPLLWILPLAVYLVTFILCFDRSGWYKPAYFRWLLPPALGLMMYGALNPDLQIHLAAGVFLFLAGLFVCTMFCHGELAHRKPSSEHLTSFYLMVSLGGALGSLAVALIAPRVSTWPVEFPQVLVLCGLLAISTLYAGVWLWGRRIAQAALWVTLALLAVGVVRMNREGVAVLARNFYASLCVTKGPGWSALYSGSTVHGTQIFLQGYGNLPTTYYAPQSGIATVLRTRTSPWRVGIVGLGAGTLAAYGRPGDSFTFYEIDPNVIRLASTEFTYLKSSRAAINISLGDGRLLLNQEPSHQFDLLTVDAFSGDAIPTHLLTREAFELYLRVLKPGGLAGGPRFEQVCRPEAYTSPRRGLLEFAGCFDPERKGLYGRSGSVRMGDHERRYQCASKVHAIQGRSSSHSSV